MHLKKFFFVLIFLYPLVSYSDENLASSKVFVEKLGKQVVEKGIKYRNYRIRKI